MSSKTKPIDEILEDLFRIDPSLKKHKKEIERLVAAMLSAKPDTRFDAAFARQLKSQLLAGESEAVMARHTARVSDLMQKWIYGFGGAAVALVLVVAIMNAGIGQPNIAVNHGNTELFMAKTVALPRNAFGTLTSATPSGVPMRETANAPAFGMGGGGSAGSSVAPVTPLPTDSANMTDAKMIAPNPVIYDFVYKGDDLKLEQTQGDVFMRLKGASASFMVSNLASMGLNLVNINSFNNLKLAMFQVLEDKPNGLMLNVDMNDESVSIYQNWLKWDYNQTPPSQAPSDEETIRIARDFLTAHGIDASIYGEPSVDHRWDMVQPVERSATMPVYIPSDLTVRFPLKLNGVAVREQYGDEYGLFVNVNIALKTVSGVTNLTTQRYEKSSYDLETDSARILKLAQQGGSPWYWQPDESVKHVEVELGTPVNVYMRYWLADGNTSKELYVPALYFPVKEKPQDAPYLQDGITVPLVKEVLDQYGQTPEIMPMEKSLMSEPAVNVVPPTPASIPGGAPTAPKQ